jgi:dihydrofolate synthase/folylpolyglutamate synthase
VDGISHVIDQIKSTPHKNLHFVLGMVNDKDIIKVLRLLPPEATYYFCKADIPRGMDQDKLKTIANSLGLIGNAYYSVLEAYTNAKENAQDKDLIFVGGSTYVVAEVL